nr:MAG TPA: hypothetical protein [Caudoviricetes sp.]
MWAKGLNIGVFRGIAKYLLGGVPLMVGGDTRQTNHSVLITKD